MWKHIKPYPYLLVKYKNNSLNILQIITVYIKAPRKFLKNKKIHSTLNLGTKNTEKMDSKDLFLSKT